jgi:dipeptidyl-peptidase 4
MSLGSIQRASFMRSPQFVALAAWTVLAGMPADGRAQGTKADYERADALRERARDKVLKSRVRPHWFDGGTRFWYRNDLGGGAREFVVVEPARGERRPAFDHARLADALTKATDEPHSPTRLPFDAIAFEDGGSVLFNAGDQGWCYDPGANSLEKAERVRTEQDETERLARGRGGRRQPGSPRREESPDGRWVAFVRNHDLFLRDKKSGEEFEVSSEGTESDGYEPRAYWSPDSTKLVAMRTARGDERTVHLIESSPRDQLQPRLHAHNYLKPGDRVPVSRPHLFDVAGKKEIPISGDLSPNPWRIEGIHWSPDSSQFSFVYNQRGHQVVRLIAVDARSGESRAVIDEQSRTFIDYSQKWFLHHLDQSDEIIWMSERDGWNHLYLIDARTGMVKNPITRGEWVVRGVDRVDAEKRQVWFRAGGLHAGQDPYFVHYARVNFDGTDLVILTRGAGTHQIEYSPDGQYLIDSYSRVDLPPVTELRRAEDGGMVCELERADWSALRETGWKAPEPFVAKGRDGQTDIYGVIFRPTNFDPTKRYPVVEQIYAGPQGAFVPKGFSALHRAQSLAELGFVVVQIDGMGTNWRSKAFHDVCWKNLGDAGLPDRILWMKAAAAKDPALDLSRVGVYGSSAGGQSALGALLFHPEFYKVGAADCGCHDNRMDKIWWNEAWMGWPIGPHYADQSNATNAHRLQGKLLLTVGEMDHNVDPASTMQVVNALIKADKDFELIVFPGSDHGAGSSPYGERRRRDFFVRHLLGVEPRAH